MFTKKLPCLLLMGMLPLWAIAGEKVVLKDETARINYSLGYQIGNDFKQQGVKMDPQAIVKGIEDALAGNKPLMSPQDMHTILVNLKRKVVAEQTKMHRKSAQANIKADKQFMETKLKEKGVKTTKSGLAYRIVSPGTGKRPGATDTITVNYRGTLTNGSEFDSSYKRGKPASFSLSKVIKGWTEGVQLIREGGKIQLFIPSKLAYGERGPLAHRTLVFNVELISVNDKAAASHQANTPNRKSGDEK